MPPKPASSVPPEERVPVREKLALSFSACTDWIATTGTMNNVLVPFYTIGLGLSPALMGLVQVVWRLWDAITDPVMGHISDKTRSRWGRRRPYIAFGGMLVALLYPMLWRPPAGLSETGLAIYLGLFGMLYFTCFTIWSMPYYGLQMEMTPNYDERTRLASWIMIIVKFGSLVTGWLPWLVASHWFADPETGQADIVHGTRTVSWGVAALIMVLALLPAFFVRERFKEAAPAAGSARAKAPGFLQTMRESATCRPLWALIGVSFLYSFGSGCVNLLGQFTSIYYVCGGDLALHGKIVGLRSTLMLVAGFATVPLWAWVAQRLDKTRALTLLMSVGMAAHASNFFLMTPKMPYLQIVSGLMEALPFSALWLLMPAMKADVADYDELHTGRRREGNLNAFYSWFFKAALTASVGVGGLVASLSGYDAKLPMQPPEVLSRMFHLYLWLPILIWLCAIYCLRFYSLSRERMEEIREELTRRRGEPRLVAAS